MISWLPKKKNENCINDSIRNFSNGHDYSIDLCEKAIRERVTVGRIAKVIMGTPIDESIEPSIEADCRIIAQAIVKELLE